MHNNRIRYKNVFFYEYAANDLLDIEYINDLNVRTINYEMRHLESSLILKIIFLLSSKTSLKFGH